MSPGHDNRQITQRRRSLARTFGFLRLERRLARERNDMVAEYLTERAIRAVQASCHHMHQYNVI